MPCTLLRNDGGGKARNAGTRFNPPPGFAGLLALPDVGEVEWETELSRRRRRADHVDDLLRPGRDFASRKRRRADLMVLEVARDLALADRDRSAEETRRALEAYR